MLTTRENCCETGLLSSVRLLETSEDDVAFRKMLVWLLEEQITTQRELVERLSKDISNVHHAYLDGRAMTNYSWSLDPRWVLWRHHRSTERWVLRRFISPATRLLFQQLVHVNNKENKSSALLVLWIFVTLTYITSFLVDTTRRWYPLTFYDIAVGTSSSSMMTWRPSWPTSGLPSPTWKKSCMTPWGRTASTKRPTCPSRTNTSSPSKTSTTTSSCSATPLFTDHVTLSSSTAATSGKWTTRWIKSWVIHVWRSSTRCRC